MFESNDIEDSNSDESASISTENKKNLIQVASETFNQLFNSTPPLALDTYQRDFVWNDNKIRQLFDDLVEFSKISETGSYYMGTILIHGNKDSDEKGLKQFVIDGQQRITALCVLYNQINGNLPENHALTYSPESSKLIRQAKGLFEILNNQKKLDNKIFSQIVFTVIRVTQIDLAFTFFDTQNNRGVRLEATDLLKAYHLRAVGGKQKVALQTLCAKRWESVQLLSNVFPRGSHFLPLLFSQYLWRARRWTGKQVNRVNHDALLDEFQTMSRETDDNATVPLFCFSNNCLASTLTLEPDGNHQIHGKSWGLSDDPAELPFSIRQPVYKGIGFFLYVDKYASLSQILMLKETKTNELNEFRKLYNALVKNNSSYFQEFFILAALMFYDRFGENKLFEFGLWLEYVLGTLRIKQGRVVQQTVMKLLTDHDLNLLDVIANAYLPDQVISHLQNYGKSDEYYLKNAEIDIETGNGVKGCYIKAMITYYGKKNDNTSKTSQLTNKKNWINEKLTEYKEQG